MVLEYVHMKDRHSTIFYSKKGDEDLALGPKQLLYLIIIITFLILLLTVIHLLKNILL